MTRAAPPDHDRLVKHWMRPIAATVGPLTTVREAFELMLRLNVWHLLVLDGVRLVGVVTETDLRHPDWRRTAAQSIEQLYWFAPDIKVRDVMTETVVTVSPDDSVVAAAASLVERQLDCLPVVADGRVLGLLARDELLTALLQALGTTTVADGR